MPTSRDYYEILGVSREADDSTIKKAYRRLAMEYHPDRNGGDETADKFREVSEAYEVLSDLQKRNLYNQYGHEGLRGQNFRSANDIFSGFQSIFEDFFGGDPFGASRRRPRGRDLKYNLEIDLREAIKGVEKIISIKRLEICDPCAGSGAKPGSQPTTCATCQGHGKVTVRQGFFMISQTCPQCRGEGQLISDPCPSCHGNKLAPQEQEIEVKIPPGVDTGVRLRLSEEGEPAPGGDRGDLYIDIEVLEDEFFERDGSDLYTKLYVPYPVAALGGSITAPLIEGQEEIKIPKGMPSPYIHKISKQGVPNIRTHKRGDLYVEMHIESPTKLSGRAKELIEELHSELSKKATPQANKKKKRGQKKSPFSFFS